MPMLDANLTAQLKSHLEQDHPARRARRRPSTTGRSPAQLAELLDEIAALSDQITVRRADDDARRPSFRIDRVGTDVAVRFAGIPLGHEFTSLVLALLQVGGHPSTASAELIAPDRGARGQVPLRDLLLADLPELPRRGAGAEPDERPQPQHHPRRHRRRARSRTRSTPARSWPCRPCSSTARCASPGRMSLEQIVGQARHGRRRARRRAPSPTRTPSTCSWSAAAPPAPPPRSTPPARASAPAWSPSASAARCSTPWPSRTSSPCPTPRAPSWPPRSSSTCKEYDVDVMNLQRATRLVPADDDGLVTVELASGAIAAVAHRRALHRRPLALDERARRGRVPQQGRDLLPALRRPAVQGQARRRHRRRQLRRRGRHRPRRRRRPTSPCIEFDAALRADDVLQRKLRSLPNVDIIVSALTTEVLGDGDQVTGLIYEDRTTGEVHQVDLDGIFVQIGLLPEHRVARGHRRAVAPRRGRDRRPGPDLGARRVRRRRLHHRAVQADRDRHGRRRHRRAERLRPPHPHQRPATRPWPRLDDGRPPAPARPWGGRVGHRPPEVTHEPARSRATSSPWPTTGTSAGPPRPASSASRRCRPRSRSSSGSSASSSSSATPARSC